MHDPTVSGRLTPVRQIFRIQQIEIILILWKGAVAGINGNLCNIRIKGFDIAKKIIYIRIKILIPSLAVVCCKITLQRIIHIKHIRDCIIIVCFFIQIFDGMLHLVGQLLIKTFQLNFLRISISKDCNEKHGKKCKECIVKNEFILNSCTFIRFFHQELSLPVYLTNRSETRSAAMAKPGFRLSV